MQFSISDVPAMTCSRQYRLNASLTSCSCAALMQSRVVRSRWIRIREKAAAPEPPPLAYRRTDSERSGAILLANAPGYRHMRPQGSARRRAVRRRTTTPSSIPK